MYQRRQSSLWILARELGKDQGQRLHVSSSLTATLGCYKSGCLPISGCLSSLISAYSISIITIHSTLAGWLSVNGFNLRPIFSQSRTRSADLSGRGDLRSPRVHDTKWVASSIRDLDYLSCIMIINHLITKCQALDSLSLILINLAPA